MSRWTKQYFHSQIYQPTTLFIARYEVPEMVADTLLRLHLAWQTPRHPTEMKILFERNRKDDRDDTLLRIKGIRRSLCLEEEASFSDAGIRRNVMRYESHRFKGLERVRLAWNSPHSSGAECDPSDYHTYWHYHEKDTEGHIPCKGYESCCSCEPCEKRWGLFSEYLEWLEKRVCGEVAELMQE